jgi:hypothetical protein
MEGAGTTTSGGAEAARGMRQEGYFGFLDALGTRGRWQVDPPTKIVSDYEEWYTRVTAVDSATGIGSLDHVNEAAIPRLRGAARPASRRGYGHFLILSPFPLTLTAPQIPSCQRGLVTRLQRSLSGPYSTGSYFEARSPLESIIKGKAGGFWWGLLWTKRPSGTNKSTGPGLS